MADAKKTITVETVVNAPVEKVWDCFTKPNHITGWYFASNDWEAPSADNDLRAGGKVTQTFKIEHQNTPQKQRGGWQSILDNFKKYTENQG